MACDFTLELLCGWNKHSAFSDYAHVHNSLVKQAEEDSGSASLGRAFYTVEHAYHVLLPKFQHARCSAVLSQLARAYETARDMRSWRLPRSREGLTDLKARLNALKEEACLELYTKQLSNSSSYVLDLEEKRHATWAHGIDVVDTAATHLRCALNPSTLPESNAKLRQAGKKLSGLYRAERMELTDSVDLVEALLSMSSGVSRFPWNKIPA